jgi:hypothetical protein
MSGVWGVAVDANRNVYITNSQPTLFDDEFIRVVTPAGIISTFAGNGYFGYSGDGGPATKASFTLAYGLAFDKSGDLYIADSENDCIRMVTPAGIVSTVAGIGGNFGYSGDNGLAIDAKLNVPGGVAIDAAGDIYIADTNNYRVRKVTPGGIISLVAGNGTPGYSGDGGLATAAELNNPTTVAIDGNGNLFIADSENNRIRKVTPAGIISTYAGNGVKAYGGDNGPATSAALNLPYGVAVDASGNVYIADSLNNRVRQVTPAGIITTIVGDGVPSFSGDNGPATSAGLDYPASLAFDASGNLYIADLVNERVREVFNSTTAAPTFTPPAGTYTSTQTVTLADATPNATIYYTTNGTTPTASSTVYTAPITVSTSATIQAIAIAPGYTASSVATAIYTIH